MISPVGISWILNSIMMPVSLPFPSSESPGGFLSTLHLFFQVYGKKIHQSGGEAEETLVRNGGKVTSGL